MTDDQTALARRAVACKAWRWTAGMLAVPDGFVGDALRVVSAGDFVIGVGANWMSAASDGTCYGKSWLVGRVPDLDDPATIGCLLALVRETWGDPHIGIYPVKKAVGPAWWNVGILWDATGLFCGTGPTEAEALVAALEAAP